MSARAAVYTLLKDDPTLQTLVSKWYAANAVDAPKEECFGVIRWEYQEAVFGNRGPVRVTIWIHDRNRDYGRISEALSRARDLLLDAVHVEGADGWTLTTATSNGEGPDLYDQGYETCTRYAEFVVVSRRTS